MATYYVSTTGDDEAAGGIGAPWATLAKAVSTIVAGDTVYLRSGTWAEALNIAGKAYASLTTFARYPDDAVGSVILDGTGIDLDAYEEGVIWIHATSSNVRVDGIKVINASHTGIAVLSSANIDVRNCISDTSLHAGIAFWNVDDSTIYGNTIYNSNMPAGSEEIISICAGSTNITASYNTLYAGNRTFAATGGEGLNVKDGCSYIYVHHNTVDMARPDLAESDRYCMGVDGWTAETHHIYFYDNILKNGSWGLQYNSEEGGATHHIYGWNNIISHIGHGSTMHGGGIGFPSYGNTPGIVSDCYWWNNTLYDCYYGAKFDKEEVGANVLVQNNIINGSEIADTYFGATDEGDVTLDHNLLTTDPLFVNPATSDFHLQAGSPAIGQGATLSGPLDPGVTVDYDAKDRGAVFDIGAYEYAAGTASAKIGLRHVTIK